MPTSRLPAGRPTACSAISSTSASASATASRFSVRALEHLLPSRGRRAPVVLVAIPAVGFAVLGLVLVTSVSARQATATFGDPRHFAYRHVVALLLTLPA